MAHSEMQNFSDRLRKQREKLGIRKHELAKNVGVSLTTIQQYESGQMPRGEFAVRLAHELNCSLDWLLAGRKADINHEINQQDLVHLPVVEAIFEPASDGFALRSCARGHYVFYADFLHAKGDPSKMVLLRVMGDSMQPRILNNDMVLIDQGQTKLMPSQMYAINIEGMVYIKLVDAVPSKLLLSSVNPAYTPIELDIKMQSSINIIGRVIWLGRDLS